MKTEQNSVFFYSLLFLVDEIFLNAKDKYYLIFLESRVNTLKNGAKQDGTRAHGLLDGITLKASAYL